MDHWIKESLDVVIRELGQKKKILETSKHTVIDNKFSRLHNGHPIYSL